MAADAATATGRSISDEGEAAMFGYSTPASSSRSRRVNSAEIGICNSSPS